MDLQLEGRVVLIAGASRGIGRTLAASLLAEGARVALTARGPAEIESTRELLAQRYGADKVWARACDMRYSENVETVVADVHGSFGSLWGAVANVGLHPCPPGFEIDDETWNEGFAQNLDSAFRLARATLRRLAAQREGALLLISSTAGLAALGSPLTYGTAKAAINHLTKELARLVGASGVRVNAVAPGNVIFSGGEWDQRLRGPRADSWKRWIEREVPLRRFATPEEIAAVCTFLLSPVASFVSAAIVPVDGGQTR